MVPFDQLSLVCLAGYHTIIGSYREIAIAIESEAGDSLTSIDQSGFSRKERNLHCDVHATYTSPENEHILPPFRSRDSLWMTRSQRPRRRDKGLFREYLSVLLSVPNVLKFDFQENRSHDSVQTRPLC